MEQLSSEILYGFVKRHWTLFIAIVVLVIIMILLPRHKPQPPQVVQTTPDTKTVYVDKPVITEKVVQQYVTDPKAQATIASLMKQIESLKAKPTTVTVTEATNTVEGGTDKGGTVEAVPNTSDEERKFSDWQLSATYSSKTFSYLLTQKFEIATTSGRDKDGRRLELVRLYQLDATGARIQVPAQTTVLQADETYPHFMVNLNIQGGVIASDVKGGFVGAQWLKYGRTKASGDLTYALLTPGFFFSGDVKELGVLPVSWNLGSVKHQPLTNMWFSPYVGVNIGSRSISRIGGAVTATF